MSIWFCLRQVKSNQWKCQIWKKRSQGRNLLSQQQTLESFVSVESKLNEVPCAFNHRNLLDWLMYMNN